VGADRVVLVRHGESLWNAERRWQGQEGPGLSETGHRQAKITAAYLVAHVDDVSLLVSSDLPRVVETAEPAARALALVMRTDRRLREIDVGWWSGLTTEEVLARSPGDLAAIRGGDDLPRGGAETVADLRARVAPAVAELAASCDGGTALVFCHGGPVRAVVGDALGLSIIGERTLAGPENCSLTELSYRNGSTRLTCYNETAHLIGL
jgi:broad specificity phosphatase PhoE